MKEREEREIDAAISLDGLSVGDAFGELFANSPKSARQCFRNDHFPPKPWWYTDDTEMAIGIYEVLLAKDHIEQELLAQVFALRYMKNPDRGYGKMTRLTLERISTGKEWHEYSKNAFGFGSMGNGAAMRVAPIGAYFSDDFECLVKNATLSAKITHMHKEGIAGAIAIALAVAVATQSRDQSEECCRQKIFQTLIQHVPKGDTLNGIQNALKLPFVTPIDEAVKKLGNGALVTAPDTVPFVIWSATKHLSDFTEALLATVQGGGDCDTNCAMVGAIVASYVGKQGIPDLLLASREVLEFGTL